MKKNICLFIGLTLVVSSLLQPIIALGAPTSKAPTTSSASVILIDADSGRVIYEKNASKKMYPASTTKIFNWLFLMI